MPTILSHRIYVPHSDLVISLKHIGCSKRSHSQTAKMDINEIRFDLVVEIDLPCQAGDLRVGVIEVYSWCTW